MEKSPQEIAQFKKSDFLRATGIFEITANNSNIIFTVKKKDPWFTI
jgi:hypothetical protein